MRRIQCDEVNQGLVAYLFPEYRWVWYPYTPFVTEHKLIVVCDIERDMYPHKECIYLTKHSGVKVDTKEGFLTLLSERWALDDKLRGTLLSIEEPEFWEVAKYFWLMGTLPTGEMESPTGSVFKMFRTLFRDYGETYCTYKCLGKSYKAVFSGLISMMLRTQQELVTQEASDTYKKVQQENRLYYSWFRRCVVEYMSSERRELDFLSFLWECAQARRGSAL